MVKSLLFLAVIVLFGCMAMYNHKILAWLSGFLEKTGVWFFQAFGKKISRLNVRTDRHVELNKGSLVYKVNEFLKDIIVNLELSKENVTPVGLLLFWVSTAFAGSSAYVFWSGEGWLAIPSFLALLYFIIVLFRFISLMNYEKKELEIMDTEDLLVMDIGGGVYNAIVRYQDSFHPNIRPYFLEFIDNIRAKGYGFDRAMVILNERLGSNFTDFAQKAIIYDNKADDKMADIFSAIVERNRFKRTLRDRNNKKFNELRFQFLVSTIIIGLYGLFSIFTDPFMYHFFTNTLWGKVVIIADLVLVTAVLAYISSIKAKFL